jgi:3-(3-hydroxy-phenyl)propionate hydroxylase
MKRTKILVVGAGPVGSVAAYRLAQAGLDVALLEAESHHLEDMRASTLHPPTLAMLAELGVLDELEAQGLRAPVYHYRNRKTGNVLAFDMAEISDLTPYPYRLQCEQFKITRLISPLLRELPNAQFHFSRRLLSFEQDAEGVTAHFETPLEIETWRADYIIGADGANSTVRKWLDVAFDGFTYPEKFLTLSTEHPLEKHIPNLAGVNYVADPEEWCVLLKVPSFWRVLVPVLDDRSDEELVSDDNKDAIFSRLIGAEAASTLKTAHRTIYRVHQRVAERYRDRRVLLAGDAAHLNNPLGGFGMNSGVHDAWNLCDKLIAIDKGADPDAMLDLYERQRRTIMQEFVQAQTIKNKQTMESAADDGAGDETAMERELSGLLNDKEGRRAYLKKQAMLSSLEREAAIR